LKKLNVNVKTKNHEEYEKQPLKTLMSTIRCGYVPDGKKKRFQDYRCKDVGIH
jgi:hypothetical protein